MTAKSELSQTVTVINLIAKADFYISISNSKHSKDSRLSRNSVQAGIVIFVKVLASFYQILLDIKLSNFAR